MAKTFYAWAPVTIHNPVNGGISTIPEGTKVTKTELKDDWDNLVSSGVVRSQPYPDNVKMFESPNVTILRKAREAMDAAMAPYEPDDDEDEENG